MPIDTTSDTWTKAASNDPLRVHITSLLSKNQEQAFSIKEIDEYLLEDHQHLFPAQLAGPDAIDGAKAARQSIIASILSDRYWHLNVNFEYISGDDGVTEGLYFTWAGPGISPVATLEEISDPDPDSTYSPLASRLKQLDEDVDEVDELEERVSRLEYRIREELGRF